MESGMPAGCRPNEFARKSSGNSFRDARAQFCCQAPNVHEAQIRVMKKPVNFETGQTCKCEHMGQLTRQKRLDMTPIAGGVVDPSGVAQHFVLRQKM
mmetsp:Transcript_39901/g.60256  ORF Transcript_39901/g.60256 Transcript_39901/m.60256 type:complete len:97 (-) Transcript_39901:661-951(-)